MKFLEDTEKPILVFSMTINEFHKESSLFPI